MKKTKLEKIEYFDFGAWLTQAGLSLGALEKKSGISKTTLSRIKNGHLKLTAKTWARIQNASKKI